MSNGEKHSGNGEDTILHAEPADARELMEQEAGRTLASLGGELAGGAYETLLATESHVLARSGDPIGIHVDYCVEGLGEIAGATLSYADPILDVRASMKSNWISCGSLTLPSRSTPTENGQQESWDFTFALNGNVYVSHTGRKTAQAANRKLGFWAQHITAAQVLTTIEQLERYRQPSEPTAVSRQLEVTKRLLGIPNNGTD